jgi:hypothetical protein
LDQDPKLWHQTIKPAGHKKEGNGFLAIYVNKHMIIE